MIEKIDRICAAFAKAVCVITFGAFLAVMFLIMADVAKRTATGNAIIGTYEIVERLLMIGVFASFAYTQTRHGHVHVTMLISHLPQKAALVINGLMTAFSAAAIFMVAYASVLQTQYAMAAGTCTGVLFIPLYPFYIAEALGMAIFAVTVLWDCVKSFLALGNPALAERIAETWN